MVEPSPAPVERLIDALLDEGELVDDGQFTLDAAAAAAKLAEFRHADRSPYLVVLAEALFGLGAQALALDTELSTLVVTATGVELAAPEAALRDVYGYGLGHGEDARARALGRLAIALDMVLGGNDERRATLDYTGSGQRILAEYRWQQAPRVTVHPASTEQPGTLRIELANTTSLRSAALHELRVATEFSDRKIRVDDQRISQRPRPWVAVVTGPGPGYRFRAGLVPGAGPSTVEIWAAGVCVDRIESAGEGFRAALELDELRRDLSRMKVVRDATVEHALTALEPVRQRALAQLEQLDQGWAREGAWPPEWSPERVDQLLARPVRAHLLDRVTAPAPVSLWVLLGRNLALFARSDRSWAMFNLAIIACLSVGIAGWLFTAMPVQLAVVLSAPLLIIAAFLASVMVDPRAAARAIRTRDRGLRVRAQVLEVERIGSTGLARVTWSFTDGDGTRRLGSSMPRDAAEANKWQAGEAIVVHYDPADPDQSVWEADVGPPRP